MEREIMSADEKIRHARRLGCTGLEQVVPCLVIEWFCLRNNLPASVYEVVKELGLKNLTPIRHCIYTIKVLRFIDDGSVCLRSIEEFQNDNSGYIPKSVLDCYLKEDLYARRPAEDAERPTAESQEKEG